MQTARPQKNLDRLWLAVSGHGHGHLVQVAPLVRALRIRFPALIVCVQSGLPESLLRQALGDAIEIHDQAVDFGMVMSGPMTVLPEESLEAYRQFHDSWGERLSRQVEVLRDFKPDLVISDVPYLPLAAARVCGLPSLALCSLNWADILEHYCAGMENAMEVVNVIRSHYAAANRFLRPTPAMPMETLDNTAQIGPLVSMGNDRRPDLLQALQLSGDKRLLLLTLGGITGQVDVTHWPLFKDTIFLVPAAWQAQLSHAGQEDRFRTIESTGMSYADLFASCDALITKPGYGAFAAAGCSGLPVVYAERGDWPEEPYLTAWLKRVGRTTAISWSELAAGGFAQVLDDLLLHPPKLSVEATGAAEGVALIEAMFT